MFINVMRIFLIGWFKKTKNSIMICFIETLTTRFSQISRLFNCLNYLMILLIWELTSPNTDETFIQQSPLIQKRKLHNFLEYLQNCFLSTTFIVMSVAISIIQLHNSGVFVLILEHQVFIDCWILMISLVYII